jgi:hypothetical protein
VGGITVYESETAHIVTEEQAETKKQESAINFALSCSHHLICSV